jgi:hypothetical protein
VSSDLSHQIRLCEQLLDGARMVGDNEDLRMWRLRRDGWVSDSVRTLGPDADAATVHSFERAASCPPGSGEYFEDLPVELESVRRALAFLIGLRDG